MSSNFNALKLIGVQPNWSNICRTTGPNVAYLPEANISSNSANARITAIHIGSVRHREAFGLRRNSSYHFTTIGFHSRFFGRIIGPGGNSGPNGPSGRSSTCPFDITLFNVITLPIPGLETRNAFPMNQHPVGQRQRATLFGRHAPHANRT